MSALNIKDPRVADMARRLAKLKNTTITEAVAAALSDCLDRTVKNSEAEQAERVRRTEEIVERFQASLPPDAPSPWKVLDDMYDEDGLPR